MEAQGGKNEQKSMLRSCGSSGIDGQGSGLRTTRRYFRKHSGSMEPLDAANMMILLKVARAAGRYKCDNYVDIAGYAACAAEIGGTYE